MKKILVIRFSSIGDIVLTTPVVRCLKKQTGAEVHYLTKQQYLPLVEANPYLDKVFTIEKKTSEVIPALKKEQYDCLIDLHKNIRSWQVKSALKAKSFAFNKLNLEKWFLVNLKIDRLPNVHIVDRYLATSAPFGVINDGRGLDYFFPEPFIPKHPLPGTPYLAFAIGAAHGTKRLPTGKIVEICQQANLPIILLGGKDEQTKGETIARKSGTSITNLCGKLTLHESAHFIKNAQKVIAHDTGMMHIAAAFQKEILSVWGNTVPAFGMSPYYGENENQNTIFEVHGLSCRPCSKIGFKKCPKGHFSCMNNQNTDAIANALNAKGR